MAYVNPGKLFVDKFGAATKPEDIYDYASFLRREAGLTADPPIDLNRIYQRFEIPLPGRVPLGVTQGVLWDYEAGIILINDDDPAKRQRFSEGHELMELLFAVLPKNQWDIRFDSKKRGNFKHSLKEHLCNRGSAELLMPRESFLPYVELWGCSFNTARRLSEIYNVSMAAALVQAAYVTREECAVVLFRYKNKPTEIRSKVAPEQIALLPKSEHELPSKKLRVEWSLAGPFIPPDKSVPAESSIYTAWQKGEFTSGIEQLDLGSNMRGRLLCESQPFLKDDEMCVLSLISKTATLMEHARYRQSA